MRILIVILALAATPFAQEWRHAGKTLETVLAQASPVAEDLSAGEPAHSVPGVKVHPDEVVGVPVEEEPLQGPGPTGDLPTRKLPPEGGGPTGDVPASELFARMHSAISNAEALAADLEGLPPEWRKLLASQLIPLLEE